MSPSLVTKSENNKGKFWNDTTCPYFHRVGFLMLNREELESTACKSNGFFFTRGPPLRENKLINENNKYTCWRR